MKEIADSGPFLPSRQTLKPASAAQKNVAGNGDPGPADALVALPGDGESAEPGLSGGFTMTDPDGCVPLLTDELADTAVAATTTHLFESEEAGSTSVGNDCLAEPVETSLFDASSFDAPSFDASPHDVSPRRQASHCKDADNDADKDAGAALSIGHHVSDRHIEDPPRRRPKTVAVPVAIWVGGYLIADRRNKEPALGPAGVSRRTTFTRRCEYHGFCDPSDVLGCGGELCGKKPHGRIE